MKREYNKFLKFMITILLLISLIILIINKTYASDDSKIQSNINIPIVKENYISAMGYDNNEASFYFWANNLYDAIGKSTPYHKAGNIFVTVSQEYKDKYITTMVEAVDQYFGNNAFSLVERGNHSYEISSFQYHILYSTQATQPILDVTENGIVQNVGVYFVEEDKINISNIGTIDGGLKLTVEVGFPSTSEAIKYLLDNKEFGYVPVIDADKYAFEYDNNKIVKFNEFSYLKMNSYKLTPYIVNNPNNDGILKEGINVVEWTLDGIFSKPITWYEIYVGVNKNDIIEKKIMENPTDNETQGGKGSEEPFPSLEGNPTIEKDNNIKFNPFIFLCFIILSFYLLHIIFWKLLKIFAMKDITKAKEEQSQPKYFQDFREYRDMGEYRRANLYKDIDTNVTRNKIFDTEGYIDGEFKEIKDE